MSGEARRTQTVAIVGAAEMDAAVGARPARACSPRWAGARPPAARVGLAPRLRAELARSQPEILAWMGPKVPATFHKAWRWVAEMEQIAEFLGAPGDGAAIYAGMARLYTRLCYKATARGVRDAHEQAT
ncbi:MAG TPA: DUF1932 domain-containing protein [Candidatus Binataceae bacterium]|nr:DUF1932 domain-containing protein [Candidatus Binataceae bacterium]